LFDSRVSGSFDAFIRKNSDLISEYRYPYRPYLHERMFVKRGTSSARGVEMALSWNAVNAALFLHHRPDGSYAKARLDPGPMTSQEFTPVSSKACPRR
jgi:hypothetical protein